MNKTYLWAIIAAIGVVVLAIAILPMVFAGGEDQVSPHSDADLDSFQSETIDYSPQIAAYQDLIAANPADASAYAGLGGLYLETGRQPEAVDQLNQAIALNPNEVVYYGVLGIAYFEMGMTDVALRELEKGLAIDPNSQPLLFDLAGIYAQSGRQEEALKYWQMVYDLNPNNDFGHMAQQLMAEQTNPGSSSQAPPIDLDN